MDRRLATDVELKILSVEAVFWQDWRARPACS